MSDSTDKLKDLATQTLIDLIQQAAQGAGATKEFLVNNIPDVLQEYLKWQAGADLLCIAIFVTVVFLTYKATLKWTDQTLDYTGCWSGTKVISAAIGGVFSIITCIVAVMSTFDLLKLCLAPKLYLLEAAASLVHH